jgi:hypothetical protein
VRFTFQDILRFQIPALFLCWAWIFIVEEPVWDDWTLMYQSTQELMSVPDPRMFVWAMIQQFPFPVFLYHTGVLLSTWCIAYCTGVILMEVWKIPYSFALWASVFMIVIPVNSARVAFVNFPYILSFALYALATLYALRNRGWVNKGLVILLWMLSFMTPSLLVFHYAILFLLAFKRNVLKSRFFLLALLLPLIAWAIRNYFFQPEEIYAEYYAIHLKDAFPAIFSSFWVLIRQAYEVLIYITRPSVYIPTILLGFPVWFTLRNFLWDIPFAPKYWMLAGIFLLMSAVYPYMLIHKEPGLWDWQSRHQLLMAPGILLCCTALIKLFPEQFRTYFITVLISSCMGICISFGLEWYRDRQHLNQLHTKVINAIQQGDYHTVQMDISEPGLFAMNRTLRMYELTARFMKDSIRQNRLYYAIPPGSPLPDPRYINKKYFLRDYVPGVGDTLFLQYP